MLSQLVQLGIQGKTEVDGQPPGVAGFGQVGEGLQGLVEGDRRLAERSAVVSPGTRLPAVGDSLVPHLASQGMVRQPSDLLSRLFGRKGFKGLDNTPVEPSLPLYQKAAVGHLV